MTHTECTGTEWPRANWTRTARQSVLLAGWLGLMGPAGCITIHIHFPKKELQKAAEQIVGEVRPKIPGADSTPAPDSAPSPERGSSEEAPAKSDSSSLPVHSLNGRPRFVTFALPEEAEEESAKAESKPELGGVKLKIATPRIKAIIKTLKKRYARLLAFYKSGAIGEANNGYLAERGLKGLSRKQARNLKLLLKAENKDRLALYSEIARENSISKKKIPAIAKVFSTEWQKKCKTGWWIQNKKGKWLKKKPPKKKSKKDAEDTKDAA